MLEWYTKLNDAKVWSLALTIIVVTISTLTTIVALWGAR